MIAGIVIIITNQGFTYTFLLRFVFNLKIAMALHYQVEFLASDTFLSGICIFVIHW